MFGYEFGFWDYSTFLIGVGDENVITRLTLVPVPMMKLVKFYLLLVNFILEFLHNLRFFLMIFVDKYTAMNLLIYK